MTRSPGVLLLDDGELNAVAAVLDRMNIRYTRLAQTGSGAEIAPPLELLIATPCRASEVRRGTPPGARSGRPLRIIASDESSRSMRRKYERMGFQILVRPNAHSDVWKLLIARTIDLDDRAEERTPVGKTVRVSTGRAQQSATLVDISNRGCRLRSNEEFCAGSRLRFDLPDTDDVPTPVSGRVVRVDGRFGPESGAVHNAALLFDDDLCDDSRSKLTELLNRWSQRATDSSNPELLSLPACQSTASPGLTLDDETDPPVSANVEVELQIGHGAHEERRVHARGAFTMPVSAHTRDEERVLIGRDISAGGMLVEPASGLAEGDRIRLAVYGPADMEPLPIDALVVRSEAEEGLALRFEGLSREAEGKLDKLVACLPQVESLGGDHEDHVGAVVSQILSRE